MSLTLYRLIFLWFTISPKILDKLQGGFMNAREFRLDPFVEPFPRDLSDPPRDSALLISLLGGDDERVVYLDGAYYVIGIATRCMDVFADEKRAYEEAGLPVPGDARIPLNRRPK